MDWFESEKAVVNVKKVSVEAWEQARKAADKRHESMGEWLTRALLTQVNLEAGPREFPPSQQVNLEPKSGNPFTQDGRGLTVETLPHLMQGMAALTTATGIKPAVADVRRAYGMVDDHVREARGLPPRPVRVRRAKPLAIEGAA